MPKQSPRTPIRPPKRTLFDHVALALALATIVAISSVALDVRSPTQHRAENAGFFLPKQMQKCGSYGLEASRPVQPRFRSAPLAKQAIHDK
jgi:hypothetical protein